MIEIPSGCEGIEIEIELEGGSETLVANLRPLFDGEDEDVVFGHAFGGSHLVAIVTTLTASTFTKLASCFATIKTNTPKTKVRIGKESIAVDGLTQKDLVALFESPGFQKAVASVRKR